MRYKVEYHKHRSCNSKGDGSFIRDTKTRGTHTVMTALAEILNKFEPKKRCHILGGDEVLSVTQFLLDLHERKFCHEGKWFKIIEVVENE